MNPAVCASDESIEPSQRARDGGLVTLRSATLDDAECLFAWQIDDRTRKYAHQPEKPTWDSHLAWLRQYLGSSGQLFIIEHNGEAAGSLRLDVHCDEGVLVSLVTDPRKYRVGVAVPALNIAAARMPHLTFHADIHAENTASIRMIEQAEYVLTRPGHYERHPAHRQSISEASFMDLLKTVHAQADRGWLGQAVHQTPLDSLDLLELRSSLEVSLKRSIPDRLWFGVDTLGDLLDGLNSKSAT